jgi:hypothetical protein
LIQPAAAGSDRSIEEREDASNKRRPAKLRPEPEDAETLARAVNAEPWQRCPAW